VIDNLIEIIFRVCDYVNN